VRAYLALLGAGFHRQTTYRLALAAGLATAAFFGVVRTAVFFALYRERDQVAGLEVADTVTLFAAWKPRPSGRGGNAAPSLRCRR
jgi:ABC-type uncharacterized transport system permease subunit